MVMEKHRSSHPINSLVILVPGLLVLFLWIAILPVVGQWKADGKNTSDAPDRKSLNGVGAHPLAVTNPSDFIQQWLKSAPAKLTSETNVEAGTAIGLPLII